MIFFWLMGKLFFALTSLPGEVLVGIIVVVIFLSLIFGKQNILGILSAILVPIGVFLLLSVFWDIEFRPVWIIVRVVAVAIDISILGGIVMLIRSKL